MSWIWEKSSLWRYTVHITRGNPAVLGLFSLVTMFVVPLASGSFLIDLTNREVDKDVRTELRRSAGMDAKLMQEANNERLRRLFFDLESSNRGEERWKLALDGRTPDEPPRKTFGKKRPQAQQTS